MAQADHLPPRNFRVRGAKPFRDLSGSFAHDFELADDSALMQSACEKRALVESGEEVSASPAASMMSRSSAASRQLSSERSNGINRHRARQDMPPANVVAARLDLLAIDKIDGPRQQRFHRLFEIQKARQIALVGCEFDQQIDVTRRRVEIRALADQLAEPLNRLIDGMFGHLTNGSYD